MHKPVNYNPVASRSLSMAMFNGITSKCDCQAVCTKQRVSIMALRKLGQETVVLLGCHTGPAYLQQ